MGYRSRFETFECCLLAGSIAGTMEQSLETQRRRRVADEIIRDLMGSEGGGKEGGDT